ncbi:MAG: MaoC/PaaZ C-terminal domain-containing protein [Candidatus Binatia bacterium]
MKLGVEHSEVMIEKVDRAMFVRYAGASGDFNPIHWNEDFAKSAGYPGVFAQGMFTAGVLATFLTNWIGETNVRRFRTRFVGQVWPGEQIVCSAKVTKVYDSDGEQRADCALEVRNEKGDRKIDGDATFLTA